MLHRFLEQLAVRLNGIYLATNELTLWIYFSNKENYQRRFQIPQPTNDIELLFRMLQTHLEDFKSEHPIIAVSLEAHPTKPAAQQFGLFETAMRNPNRLYETLARLTSLLGNDRIGTPVLEETHRPDAFRMEPFQWQLGAIEPFDSRSGQALNCRDRIYLPGLRRFRPSIPAAGWVEAAKPIRLDSPPATGLATDQRGPYLASGNWWDEKAWARAEWDIELDNGIVCRCHESAEGWGVDGIYD